jgi:flavin reductase (DIM6/NTAB) family NADH-FMN oxidoreductase RutF
MADPAALTDGSAADEVEAQLVIGDDATAATAPAAGTAAAAAPVSSSAATAKPSFVRPPPNPFVRVKPGNFSRLLYTNPVCLLTTSTPAAVHTAAQISAAAPVAAAAEPAALATGSDAAVAAACSSSVEPPAGGESNAAVAAPPAASRPRRNVMTISWLTATSNHGEFVCSMNAGRYSATMLHTQQRQQQNDSDLSGAAASSVPAPSPPIGSRFVLSVPVAGMEALVKAVGGCSGGDADANGADKFQRLGIAPCRPGNKAIRVGGGAEPSRPHGGGQKARPAAVVEEEAADAEDAALDLLAVPGCAAHLVCEVRSTCMGSEAEPRVQAHNVLFCRVTRAYVNSAYWLNGHNFIPVAAHTPPYLTFLGSGNFGHVVNPTHSAKQW